ncbi:DciA family protein [Ekhidna sp.]
MDEDPIKSFRNAFKGFLKEENLEHTYKQKQVIADWGKIMGKTIASRTTKMFFNQKTLFVKLTSAPLKSEMQNSKAQILDLIAKEIGPGEVDDVRFL